MARVFHSLDSLNNVVEKDCVKNSGNQTLNGNLEISNVAPRLVLHDTDANGINIVLQADGTGTRFESPDAGGYSKRPLDITFDDVNAGEGNAIYLRNPKTNTTQGTDHNALTRKDYVDSKVTELLQEISTLRSELNTLKRGN